MFTGIVEKKVKIKTLRKGNLLELSFALPSGVNTKIGDSISVSGCCLTVSKKNKDKVFFEIMKETIDKTIFGKKIPEYINIERAMKASDRFDGHIVTGHIDCVGVVDKIKNTKEQKDIKIKFPKKFSDFVVKKGSITVDGVSLTVSECSNSSLSFSVIPHTLKVTTLGLLKVGDCVNLEFDILSKYIVKLNKKRNAK